MGHKHSTASALWLRAQLSRVSTTTPASSANQTVASKMMAAGIKFFFMAISRNFELALAFLGVVCRRGVRFAVTAITYRADVIALEFA